MEQRAAVVQTIPFEVAAAHASMRVPVARRTQTAAEIRRTLHGASFDSASLVAVCDGDKFAGVIRIEDLLAAADDATAAALMDANAPTAMPGLDQEVAAWRAVRRGESALSVVDQHGTFRGIIPPHRLLAVLLQEHDEDMGRIGGFLKDSSAARLASEEPMRRRFWHRIPWLLLGLAGALLAADIVGWFEAQLERKLLLVFFIPGIVYLADAVGTQTETVLIRGLSVGVRIGRVAATELLAGVGIGTTLALIAAPLLWWRWADAQVALVVGLAIFATCATATLVAMGLPWLFDRSGQDPAFGSGPLATVIQDLLSIMIYLAIATAVI